MEKLKRPQQESNMSVHYSSKTDDWATPQDFFDQLDKEFHFTLDPCANEQNHKCKKFYTKEQDGLSHDWGVTQFSVILPTAERLESGSNTHMSSQEKRTLPWLCLFHQGQTQDGFTTISTERQK